MAFLSPIDYRRRGFQHNDFKFVYVFTAKELLTCSPFLFWFRLLLGIIIFTAILGEKYRYVVSYPTTTADYTVFLCI